MKEQNYKRKVHFLDADNILFAIECEIKEGRFSMSGDSGNSSGQLVDSIKPRSEAQRELIRLWNKWHLNDMKAGTATQEEALKAFKKDETKTERSSYFEQASDYLKSIGLLVDKHPVTGEPYSYGNGWLMVDLPADIIGQVETVFNALVDETEAIKGQYKGSEWQEDDSSELKALAASLELEPAEVRANAKNVGGCIWEIYGTRYYVGTEEELKEIAEEYLKDDDGYLWREKVGAKKTDLGFDDWVEMVIDTDGLGSILNHWDGSEDQQKIEETWYYVIREG
jgi:hypothetical protein